LQDSVIQNIADIASIEAGNNHIANDTYFTGKAVSGDTVNLWKIDENNNLYKGVPELLRPQNSEADAGIIWWNIPLMSALYGDSVGYRWKAGGYELFKSYGIADGAKGLVSRSHEFNGNLYADSLFVGTDPALTGADLSGVRDTLGYLQDSINIVKDSLLSYYALDSLVAHLSGATFTGKVTVQDSIVADYGRIVNNFGIGAPPASWTLYAAGTSRIDESLTIHSTETSKTGYKTVIDASDADDMRVYGYDLTGAVYKPIRLGGGVTGGLTVAYNAITATLGSASLAITGGLSVTTQISSTLATGTSPFSVTSTTANTNLNADLLDATMLQVSQWSDQKTTSQTTLISQAKQFQATR